LTSLVTTGFSRILSEFKIDAPAVLNQPTSEDVEDGTTLFPRMLVSTPTPPKPKERLPWMIRLWNIGFCGWRPMKDWSEDDIEERVRRKMLTSRLKPRQIMPRFEQEKALKKARAPKGLRLCQQESGLPPSSRSCEKSSVSSLHGKRVIRERTMKN
jgi:hypothetical protein